MPEAESEIAHALWEGADRVASSALLYVEARSALAAARRARRLSRAASLRARDRLEQLIELVHVVELRPPLVRLAGDVAERHRLRAVDAVHLASALALAEVFLISWDAPLRRAAQAAGLTVAPQA